MTGSHTFKYPIEININRDNTYSVQSIDYPCCKAVCKNLIEATNSVRYKLEDITWIESTKNKLKYPSDLTKIKPTNKNYIYSEVEIIKRYDAVPETIYYYLEFSEIAIKMLTEPYIWFSNPKSFNDPFELPEVFDLIWDKDEEWTDFKFAYNRYKDKLDVLKGFKDVNEAFITLKFNNQNILTEILNLKVSAFNSTLNKTGVACFSRYYDNILMWSHYAKKHTGIVIGYDYNKIRANHKNLPGADVDYRIHPNKLKAGEYAGEIKDFIRSEYTTRKLFNKHPSWAYEQEFRIINASGDGKYPIDKEYISELYFGCNIDKDIQKALLSITNGLNVDIYNMKKSDDTNLIRNKIKKPAS